MEMRGRKGGRERGQGKIKGREWTGGMDGGKGREKGRDRTEQKEWKEETVRF